MGSLISTEEPAHSVQGAESLLGKHNEHRAEIDAREESMNTITKNGKKLIQQTHYASSDVSQLILYYLRDELESCHSNIT